MTTMTLNGKTFEVDDEIASIVHALNAAGISTVASCSGHGMRPGRISLADGRELFVLPSYEIGQWFETQFPRDINGQTKEERAAVEPPAVDVAPIAKLTVRDGLVQRAGLYAPGLPDGDHDVFPVPLSPKGELRPHVLAEPPSASDEFPSDCDVIDITCDEDDERVIEFVFVRDDICVKGQSVTKDAPPPPPQPPPKRVIGEYAPGFRPRDADETSPVPVTTWKPAANGLCEHCGLSWFLHIVEDEQGCKDVCTSLAALGKTATNAKGEL